MKRVTFVFIGIIAITTIVLLTQNKTKEQSASIVKFDVNKQRVSGIFTETLNIKKHLKFKQATSKSFK